MGADTKGAPPSGRCAKCGVSTRYIPGLPCYRCKKPTCIKCGHERFAVRKNGDSLPRGEYYCSTDCIMEDLKKALAAGTPCGPEADKLWLRHPGDRAGGEFVMATPAIVAMCKKFYVKQLVRKFQEEIGPRHPDAQDRQTPKPAAGPEAPSPREHPAGDGQDRPSGPARPQTTPNAPSEAPERPGPSGGLPKRAAEGEDWEKLLDDIIKDNKAGGDFPFERGPNPWVPGQDPEKVPDRIRLDWEANPWKPGTDPAMAPSHMTLEWEAEKKAAASNAMDFKTGLIDPGIEALLRSAEAGQDAEPAGQDGAGPTAIFADDEPEADALDMPLDTTAQIEAAVERGKGLYVDGRYAEACRIFQAVLIRRPGHETARFFMRKCTKLA